MSRQDLYGSISPGRENGKNVTFLLFFWSSAVTKRFDVFNFSQLKTFCQLHSKNVSVLVLAHLEPELELFEFVFLL